MRQDRHQKEKAFGVPVKLSIAAVNLLSRLRAGEWYPAYGKRTPKAMKELWDAGLVCTMGRVKVIETCFVPCGSRPFKLEKIKLNRKGSHA
jgi:hypothetical protein